MLTVQVKYPAKTRIQSFYLRGNDCGLSWTSGLKMTYISDEKNTWELELNCSQASNNVLEVKSLIDDSSWMIGSNHHINLNSSSLIDVFYPWFSTYTGSLQTYSEVYSLELGNFRDVIVYLPPSYFENTLKVHKNVLIMHDGQNLFNPSTSAFGTAWMCQDTLNGLINEGLSDEVIIVGLYNTVNRTDEYTYIYDSSEGAGGKGDLYLDFIESTIFPLVESNLRVSLGDHLGILGSSLGGLISCYAGWTRSNVYKRIGCMSSSFWWDDNNFQSEIIKDTTPETSSVMLYMDAGTGSIGEAECAVYTTEIFEYASSIGFDADENLFKYIAEGATHNEAAWGARFYIPMMDLYPSSDV